MLFTYKKHLGQNFLIDNNIKQKIIASLDILSNDIIFEIGAGNGSISSYLIASAKKVFLIELDKTLYSILKRKFSIYDNVVIFNDDFLKFNFKSLFTKCHDVKVFGNIPYKISTEIIHLLIDIKSHVRDIYIIVQKEFADKLDGKKKKSYGYISFLVCSNFRIFRLFNIHPNCFFPSPKVTSSFIRLKPKKKKFLLNSLYFKNILKLLFRNRRKKISVSLPRVEKIYKYIDISKRPEDLKFLDYIRMLNLLYILG